MTVSSVTASSLNTTEATIAPLLEVAGVEVGFPARREAAWNKALRGVSFSVRAGEVLGLVGESGSGKSLTSLAILGLVPKPGQLLAGEVTYQGRRLTGLPEGAYRKLRGAELALIPQDPLSALNPVYTVGYQIVEVLRTHCRLSHGEAKKRTIELFDQVQIPNAAERFNQYPHEFSGGMRQRALIAMALSCSPALLIADEPTTALDVTVQAQILKLLNDLALERQMGVLLITHDLGVVAEICHRVAVMYAGQVVEQAPVDPLFSTPKHPYTQGLLASIPNLSHQAGERLKCIEGQPPQVGHFPPGCAFAPRCPQRFEPCDIPVEAVPAYTCGENQQARCYLYENDA